MYSRTRRLEELIFRSLCGMPLAVPLGQRFGRGGEVDGA
jgi:hypothetical protein